MHRILAAALSLMLLAPGAARAEALVVATASGNGCVSSEIEAPGATNGPPHATRIVFHNRCAESRILYWCAEHDGADLPGIIACPRAEGTRPVALEPQHRIERRKAFLWHLPPGTRIRYQDCARDEVPTAQLDCESPALLR